MHKMITVYVHVCAYTLTHTQMHASSRYTHRHALTLLNKVINRRLDRKQPPQFRFSSFPSGRTSAIPPERHCSSSSPPSCDSTCCFNHKKNSWRKHLSQHFHQRPPLFQSVKSADDLINTKMNKRTENGKGTFRVNYYS